MRQKTFLILIFAVSLTFSGCGFFGAQTQSNNNTNGAQSSSNYQAAKKLATLESAEITESSGLVASILNQNVFWTHNDSGGGEFLYAFDGAGKKRGVWRVAGAKNVDWEDLAVQIDGGKNYLLIGDIGNNALKRGEGWIYRVAEPEISDGDKKSSKKSPLKTAKAEKLTFSYPDEKRDAETLLFHQTSGEIYIVSKNLVGEATVYKLDADFDKPKKQTAQKVGTVRAPSLTPGFFTGGAISIDGKRLILCDYFAAYEYLLPATAKNFDDIFKTAGQKIELGERQQGEAVTYAPDGKKIFATSEKKNPPLIAVERK